MERKSKARTEAIAYGNTGLFDDGEGKQFQIDSAQFQEWLTGSENTSFRFEYEDNGYRARREIYSGNVYWYAVKKVLGKVVRRSIGKPEEVNQSTLKAVAEGIKKPVEKKVDLATNVETTLKQPHEVIGSKEIQKAVEKATLPLIGRITVLEAEIRELKNSLPRREQAA